MEELKTESLKLAPVGVPVASAFGVSLADWVYIVTFIYMTLQIILLTSKLYNGFKNKKSLRK